MLALFKSHFSLMKSILTLDPSEEEISSSSPTSIFSIAKKHNLNEVYLLESNMTGFLAAYNQSKKENINLRFGVELIMCSDLNNKNEESLDTEHKINIWMKNSEGYSDLCKLISCANVQGFYYVPRIDEQNLFKFLTKNLTVTVPFYDSFISNNLLKFNTCIFNYEKFNPTFFLQDNSLPFDFLIRDKVNSLGVETEEAKSILYYKKEDVEAFQTLRAISKRASLDKPNLNHFSSDEFCFESYLEKI